MAVFTTSVDTAQAVKFLQEMGNYLKTFNLVLIKEEETLKVVHQATGESVVIDGFPVLFKGPQMNSITPFPMTIGTVDPRTLRNENGNEELLFAEEDEDQLFSHTDAPTPTPLPSERLPSLGLEVPVDLSIVPGQQGRYFALERDVAPLQQRERIAICPPSAYPVLRGGAPVPVHLVVTTVRGFNTEYAQQCAVDPWPASGALELHPKTPELLSNNLDKDADGQTGFFFHITIFTYDRASCSYRLVDQVTTSTFRTVSHSKLCVSKRRPTKGRRARRTGSSQDLSEPY